MARTAARALSLGEDLLLPLDRVRAAVNLRLLRLAPTLVRREARITARILVGVAVALTFALGAPVALFALAPIALGVPHLAADLRYLVLRPRYSRAVRVALLLGCIPFLGLRLAPHLTVGGYSAAQLEMAAAGLGLVAAALAAGSRLLIALPVLGALTVGAVRHAEGARLIYAHLHNLVAIAAWLYLFRPKGTRRSLTWALAGLAIGIAACLGFGAVVPSTVFGRVGLGGMQLSSVATWLAPGLPLRLGVGLAVSYIFLQSVHYTVWLGVIPEETVRGEAARSFRMSLRALVRDFGAVGLLVITLGSVLVVALASRDLNRTRDAYLSLSAFHGYLELAVLTLAACGQRAVINA